MGQARCTMNVEGLDCPVEAGALQAALDGASGVVRLDFDLIHGSMTVHFRDDLTSPPELLRRVSARTGMIATFVEDGAPRRGRFSLANRWMPTLGSGLLL